MRSKVPAVLSGQHCADERPEPASASPTAPMYDRRSSWHNRRRSTCPHFSVSPMGCSAKPFVPAECRPHNRAGEIGASPNVKLITLCFVGTNRRHRRLRRGARAYVVHSAGSGRITARGGWVWPAARPGKVTRGRLETGTTPFFIDATYSKSGGFPRFWRAGTARNRHHPLAPSTDRNRPAL
jgi:hypothetical protein